MDNDNTQPLVIGGKLTKECYSNLQEFLDDLVQQLRIPLDTIQIIKGAAGQDGARGAQGAKGDKGDKGVDGTSITPIVANFAIPNGATYVDIPVFTGWDRGFYQVYYRGQLGSTDPDIPNFDPAAKVVSVGTIIALYAVPVTTIRVFFTFLGVAAVPDANHQLRVVAL